MPRRLTEDDAGSPRLELQDAGSQRPALSSAEVKAAQSELDPHGLQGIEPPHGPFTGGQLALIRGRGFTPKARVWFGAQEADPSAVVTVDGGRIQITVPAGTPGLVNIAVQNGDDPSTRRELADAYEYDALQVGPRTGATSGGTELTVLGAGTDFGEGTTVTVGGAPCSDVSVVGPEELHCVTPPGAPGVQSVRVTTGSGSVTTLLDAFSYSNSDNGFRGGLSGAPIAGELSVIALDVYSGSWIPGAWVILGDDITGAQRTDAHGVARLTGIEAGTKPTITVAQKCYQPITLADVPVDRLTVYLDPVLSPACGELGDLPSSGSLSTDRRTVSGELTWPSSTSEFARDGWTNVPNPKYPGDQLSAYVFTATSNPERQFQLPGPTAAITPASDGTIGFRFEIRSAPANLTLYALAGVENRTVNPPRFAAYSMGIARGILVEPNLDPNPVFIRMDIPLDHAYSLDVEAPQPTSRGPDRIRAQLSVKISDRGYMSLPAGSQTQLLPLTGPLQFVGLPPLSGPLSGASLVVTARAVTGPSEGSPSSVLGVFGDVPTLNGFVELPVLQDPSRNGQWNGRHIALSWAGGGAPVDLSVIHVRSGGNLMDWTVVLPNGVKEIALPDLAALGSNAGLIPGAVTVTVSAAQIDNFDYGSLRYRQLTEKGWNAFATDSVVARYVASRP